GVGSGPFHAVDIRARHEVPLLLVMLPERGAADGFTGDSLTVSQTVGIAIVGDAIEGGVKAVAGVEAQQGEGIAGELARVAQRDGAEPSGIVGDRRAV